MIRDVLELRRSGLETRRVAEPHIPVGGMAGRDAPPAMRTLPCTPFSPHLASTVDPEDQIVYAARADPPPERAGMEQRLL
jgi:hypothetical protein